MRNKALGIMETMGFLGVVEALDAALKAADVEFLSQTFTTGGLACITITGDVSAVKAAVDAGSAEASRLNVQISTHVIARPDEDVFAMLSSGENDVRTILRRKSDKDLLHEQLREVTSPPTAEPSGETPPLTDMVKVMRSMITEEEILKILERADDITAFRVTELRRILRVLNIDGIRGREISRMRKTDVLEVLRKFLSHN